MATHRIPWAQPYLGEEEVDAVVRLLRERRLSMGDTVRRFEEDAAAVAGRRHGIALANGSVALDVALKLVGVGPGDAVLVSSLAYVATTNSILWQGAQPVFCDVDPASLNIDPVDVASRITSACKVLLVTDYCGAPADYERLRSICDEAGITIVVDGAQSIGSRYRGVPTCAMGDIATMSFHSAKAVVCGEGGMVFVDDDELAERARRLRGQGEIPGRKYVHDTLAYNYRLTELAAALGRVQLSRLPEIAVRRKQIAARYVSAIEGSPLVERVQHLPDTEPSWFSFAVRVPERDAVALALGRDGIETRSLYPMPAYRQPIPEYRPYAGEWRPHAELASTEVLNLPLFYEMSDEQVDEVASALIRAVESVRSVAC